MSVQTIEAALMRSAEETSVPGFVAAAHGPGGDYHGAFGHRGVADLSPMTDDTLFWIASMTKLVTSVAAMQLVEQGRLSLEQDAADFIPAINDTPILEGFDASGEPRLRPAKSRVTLAHLLTHTAGFGYEFMDADLARYGKLKDLKFGDPLAFPRLSEAGERWRYGVNTDLVGQIVEIVSGQTLDVYFKANVFDPLAMADTAFALTDEQKGRLASMHARLPDGGLAPIPFDLPPPPHPMLGGGCLYGTAGDYLKLLTALLSRGQGPDGPILRPESVVEMMRNQVGELDCGDLKTSNPAYTNDFLPMPGVPKRWGLGLLLNQSAGPDGRSSGSGAWAGLGNGYYWLDPAAGVAGVILMQLLPFADAASLTIASAFERAVYA